MQKICLQSIWNWSAKYIHVASQNILVEINWGTNELYQLKVDVGMLNTVKI